MIISYVTDYLHRAGTDLLVEQVGDGWIDAWTVLNILCCGSSVSVIVFITIFMFILLVLVAILQGQTLHLMYLR